jgi:vancomycin resistance protein VanW
MLPPREAEAMSRWTRALVAAASAGVLAAGLHALGAHGRPRPVALGPCAGEALDEDGFPPLATAVAAVPARPGGTRDAPGAPDGRPETFVPDEAAFRALLDRVGATVEMSSYRTSFAHASPSQAANIALVAKRLNGRVIPPGAVFSYNDATGPFTVRGGYGWGRMFVGDQIVPTIGGGVCQGASTLFNVVLLANLPIVERHLHGLTVPYLPPGRDATVTEVGGLDFRFRNDTGGPLVLWAEAKDRWLTIRLYGTRRPPRVEVFTEVLRRTPFATRVVRDPDLAPGEEVVAAAGQEGVTARAWVVVTWPDGRTERRDLGTHTYRPSPRIVLRGPSPRAQAAGGGPGAASEAPRGGPLR